MESAESTWLKSVFQETDHQSDDPPSKRIKFSEVSDEIKQQFPEKNFTQHGLSRLIQHTFPRAVSKRCGKARQVHLCGLERKSCESTPKEPPLSSQNDLLVEIQQLKDRIAELEMKSEDVLCRQADEIIQHKSVVSQGPISLEAFHQLDFESIVAEIRTRAPDLYHLFMALGDTQRNKQKSEVTTEEIKAISGLCSTLNARSARLKGLQLLTGMMLVARGTSRQVCMHAVE